MYEKKNSFIEKVIAVIIMVAVVAVALCFVFGVYNYNHERDIKNYNDGICTECGGKYRLAAVSHGYFYYECEKCKHTISIIN